MGRFFSRLGIAALILLAVGIFVTQSGIWRDFSDASGIGNPDAQLSAPTVPRPGAGKDVIPNPFDAGKNSLEGVGVDVDGFYDEALKLLDKVPVVGGNAKEYDETKFGDWNRDKNGCTTVQQVLGRDTKNPVYVDETSCTPSEGTLLDPYTGQTVTLNKTADNVEVIHVVDPENAWVSGANRWSSKKRNQFYNDTENLLTVATDTQTPPAGASPDMWMPQNADTRCVYVSAWVQAKHRWNLSMTPQEAETINEVLRDCMRGDNNE